MVERQRKIGQQIMAVRMILGEQEKTFSYLQIDTIANAMNVSGDEVRELVYYCGRLDWRCITNNLIAEAETSDDRRFIFAFEDEIKRYFGCFWENKFDREEEQLDHLIDFLKKERNFDIIGQDDLILRARLKLIRKGVFLFGRKYIDTIEEMRSKDYDWAVIVEMLGKEHAWIKWFEEERADRNFEYFIQIAKIFS